LILTTGQQIDHRRIGRKRLGLLPPTPVRAHSAVRL